jgi:hypothetical protein
MSSSPAEAAPPVPPASAAAVAAWMRSQGWTVLSPRWGTDPEAAFYVWQEDEPRIGRSHALWIAESMVRRLTAGELVEVLNSQGIAQEIQISYKIRIEERGNEYRVSVVPRPSGEMKRMDELL